MYGNMPSTPYMVNEPVVQVRVGKEPGIEYLIADKIGDIIFNSDKGVVVKGVSCRICCFTIDSGRVIYRDISNDFRIFYDGIKDSVVVIAKQNTPVYGNDILLQLVDVEYDHLVDHKLSNKNKTFAVAVYAFDKKDMETEECKTKWSKLIKTMIDAIDNNTELLGAFYKGDALLTPQRYDSRFNNLNNTGYGECYNVGVRGQFPPPQFQSYQPPMQAYNQRGMNRNITIRINPASTSGPLDYINMINYITNPSIGEIKIIKDFSVIGTSVE